MLPATTTRVPEHTADSANKQIRGDTEIRVAETVSCGPEAIQRRLAELDREWDIERSLQTNFAIVSLLGLTLGKLVDRRWHWFTAVAAGFMVQHALQGWCPPAGVMRRLGFRTIAEIEHERQALKALRGDFDAIPAQRTPDEALAAAAR